ncbi:hypothetical protein [Tabrizicola sp.]|uniref:hypothetical protein n=1 Tax=Tabrizicola sp. TaxID=2005166 RepID=UPI002736D42C|nr:hypothetical protein [Tabrizicola sp.]MDP3193722.1 hypothetical protein [Tabrizicola sp.]
MQLEYPPQGFLHLMTQVLGRDHGRPAPSRVDPDRSPVPQPDPDRADRAFLLEVMNNHPEAVQSEIGMMLLMAQYPAQL